MYNLASTLRHGQPTVPRVDTQAMHHYHEATLLYDQARLHDHPISMQWNQVCSPSNVLQAFIQMRTGTGNMSTGTNYLPHTDYHVST